MSLIKTNHSARSSFQLVKKELKLVESQILDQVKAFDPELEPYMHYICNTNGKRIRPVLAILAGGATGEVNADHIKIGVILELIHMSTLVHDDVIDEAETRRKMPTTNAKWGNGMAVLLGDALFSHSLLLATEFDDIEICRKVGRASREVCQGEVMQTQRRFDLSLTKEDYFKIIAMKTGALFAAATGISSSLSGVSAQVEEQLYNYGLKLGTAYQIYDDCLDLVGTEEEVGKTLRTDLEKGKLTLPLLNIIENATPEQQARLKKSVTDEQALDFQEIIGEFEYESAVESALDTAAEMLQEARDDIQILAPSKWRDALEEITTYLDGLLNKCRR